MNETRLGMHLMEATLKTYQSGASRSSSSLDCNIAIAKALSSILRREGYEIKQMGHESETIAGTVTIL